MIRGLGFRVRSHRNDDDDDDDGDDYLDFRYRSRPPREYTYRRITCCLS